MGVEATISGVANHADEIAEEAKTLAEDLQTNMAELSRDFTGALTETMTNLSNLSRRVSDNLGYTMDQFEQTNANVSANASDIDSLESSLANEVTARTNKDTELDGKITNLTTSLTAEVNRAGAAETVLDGKIAALEESMSGGAAETLQAAKDYTDTKVLAEKTAREAKETQIKSGIRIPDETSRKIRTIMRNIKRRSENGYGYYNHESVRWSKEMGKMFLENGYKLQDRFHDYKNLTLKDFEDNDFHSIRIVWNEDN
jgi:uncharacterized protein YoxC